MSASPSFTREVAEGVRASLGAGLGYFPIGMAFGLLVVQSGLPAWLAPGLSTAVYGGALEFLLISMLTAQAPLITVALAAFFVNFRHVFYVFAFPLHVIRHPVAKLYSVYALTDEAFAIAVAHPGRWKAPALLAMQVSLQTYWVIGGVVGACLASLIPGQIRGLDFAMCALFITLTLDASRARSHIPSLMLGAAAFILGILLMPAQPMFAAMLGFGALLAVRYWAALRFGLSTPRRQV